MAAVNFIASKSASVPHGHLQLRLRVQPGASKARQGITRVTDEAVEICVAAQPRDGEANKAVITILSAATGITKSDIVFAKGLKSRDKIVTIANIRSDGPGYVQTILELLHKASSSRRADRPIVTTRSPG